MLTHAIRENFGAAQQAENGRDESMSGQKELNKNNGLHRWHAIPANTGRTNAHRFCSEAEADSTPEAARCRADDHRIHHPYVQVRPLAGSPPRDASESTFASRRGGASSAGRRDEAETTRRHDVTAMPPRFAFRLTTLHQGRVPLSDRNAPRHYFGSAPTSVATVDETGASGFDAAAVDFDDDTLRFGSDATTAPTDEPSELTTELAAAAPVVSSEPADAAALPNAALPDVKTLPAEAAPEPISAEPTLPSCEAVATPVPAAPVNAPATPPIAAAGLVPATVAIVLAALFAALVSAPAGLATGSAATRPPIAPATGVPFAVRASVPATVFAAAVSAAGLATESAFARPLATLVMGVIGLLPIAFASVPTTLFTTPGNGLLFIAPEIAPAAVLPAPASAPVTLPAAPVSAPEPLLAAPANAPATLLSAPG
ncbi:hypothetical protein J4753_12100, partial [Burkholderia pseudomallei]|nr:hypothetical protein [Burkholderia pseudomallei]